MKKLIDFTPLNDSDGITAAYVILEEIRAQRKDVFHAIVSGYTPEYRAVLKDNLARRKVVYDAIANSG